MFAIGRSIYDAMNGGAGPVTLSKTVGCYAEHLTPDAYDAYHRQLEALIEQHGGDFEGPNVTSHGVAVLYLDIDCPETRELEKRQRDMLEIARLMAQEMSMHFVGYRSTDVILLRSARARYRIYMPGVVFSDFGAVLSLMELVRGKLDEHQRRYVTSSSFGGWWDEAPTKQKHMRMHGTDGEALRGLSKYRVVARVPSTATFERICVRPTARQWRQIVVDPANSLLRLASTVGRRFGALPMHWPATVCEKMFPLAIGDASDSEEDVDVDATVLCANSQFVCGRFRGECPRVDCGSVALQHVFLRHFGVLRLCTSCDNFSMQLDETSNEAPSDERLQCEIFGAHLEQLEPPRLNSLLTIPIESLLYPAGFAFEEKSELNEDGERTTVLAPSLVAPRRVGPAEMQHMTFATLGAELCELAKLPLTDDEKESVTATQLVSDEETYFGRIFSVEDALGPPTDDLTKLRIVALVAGCGVGKTTFAESLLTELTRRMALPADTPFSERQGREFYLVAVTPRTQLCGALCAKIKRAVGQCHLYSDGAVPLDATACMTTLESMYKTLMVDGELPRAPSVVLVDEVATVAETLHCSKTLSTSARARDNAMQLLFIMFARARYVLLLDKDIDGFVRLWTSLVVWYRKRAATLEHKLGAIDYVELQVAEHQKETWIEMRDTAAMTKDAFTLLESVDESRIAIFEPSARHAVVLQQLFEEVFPGQVLLQHGASTPELKAAFAAAPDAYLRANRVRVLIYNTTLGVGVSIDEPFERVYVVFRSFLSYRMHVQGSYRVRHVAGDAPGERTVHVVWTSGTQRHVAPKCKYIETVGDAVALFGERFATERALAHKFAMLEAQRNIVNARLVLDVRGPLSIVTAVADRMQQLGTLYLPLIAEFAKHDQGINVVHDDATTSTLEQRRALRDLADNEATIILSDSQTLTPDDSPAAVRAKSSGLSCIGFREVNVGRDKVFMRIFHEVAQPEQLLRLHALALFTESAQYSVAADVVRLEREAERAPLRTIDSVVHTELVVVNAVFKACDIDFDRILVGQVRLVSFDPEKECVDFNMRRVKCGDFINGLRNNAVYRVVKRRPDLRGRTAGLSLARSILNEFFGFKVVEPARQHGSFEFIKLQRAFAFLPRYCRAKKLAMTPAIEQKARRLWEKYWSALFEWNDDCEIINTEL